MREPCDGKLSSTVLRREGTRKGSDLSDTIGIDKEKIKEYIRNQEEADLIEDKFIK